MWEKQNTLTENNMVVITRGVYMKYFLMIILLFSFLSCDNNDFPVTPGTGSLGSVVFSKSCAEGSFQVYKNSAVGNTGYSAIGNTSYSETNIFSVGSSVSVKGVINSSPCHGGGSVTFTCEGSVAIDNRTIQCTSGTVSSSSAIYSGTSSFSIGTPSIQTATETSSLLPNLLGKPSQPCDPLVNPSCVNNPYPTTNASTNIIRGQIHIYDNGTKTFVDLLFPHPSYLNTSGYNICPAGFTCN